MAKASKSVDEAVEAAEEMAATASRKAGKAAVDFRHEAEELAGKAGRTADDLKDEAAELAAQAGSKLKHAASSGKDMAAGAMHGLAGAARDMAGKLEDGDPDGGSAKAAGYARKAADSIDRFSESLKSKDVDELADDARRAVREHPAIAVGAAAIIGFALARFLKSGSSGERDA